MRLKNGLFLQMQTAVDSRPAMALKTGLQGNDAVFFLQVFSPLPYFIRMIVCLQGHVPNLRKFKDKPWQYRITNNSRWVLQAFQRNPRAVDIDSPVARIKQPA